MKNSQTKRKSGRNRESDFYQSRTSRSVEEAVKLPAFHKVKTKETCMQVYVYVCVCGSQNMRKALELGAEVPGAV